MAKFTKGFGIVALAMVLNLGAAQAQHYGGGWHGGGHYYGGYRGGHYGGGWGWGGFAAGAVLGGLLAAPYYYGPPPGYYYGPPEEDAVAYCMQRFKSYDPRSGTYLGYDGYRHPCP